MEHAQITPAIEFLEALGHDELAPRLCVTVKALKVAPKQGKGKLPSSWMTICREMAAERGVDFTEDLFSFKTAPAS